MAQAAEGSIKAGSSRGVGRIRVDPGLVSGEAGPLEPRLVIPLQIEMFNRDEDQILALLGLTGFLHLRDPNNSATQVGPPATLSLLSGFPARSLPDGISSHTAHLRFQLTAAAVHRLEVARHAAEGDLFELHLRLEGPLAWLQTTRGTLAPTSGSGGNAVRDDPFGLQLGLHSELSLLWTSSIDSLRIQIDQSVWIAKVLPGFGIDNHRLVEVIFPPELPEVGNAAKAFDEAQAALHAKRYVECISKCRAIIRAWNRQVEATSKNHLAEVVGDSQGWSADDPRRTLVDSIWQALLDAANVASHPEGQDVSYRPTVQDARLHLMMTALMAEYLSKTLT